MSGQRTNFVFTTALDEVVIEHVCTLIQELCVRGRYWTQPSDVILWHLQFPSRRREQWLLGRDGVGRDGVACARVHAGDAGKAMLAATGEPTWSWERPLARRSLVPAVVHNTKNTDSSTTNVDNTDNSMSNTDNSTTNAAIVDNSTTDNSTTNNNFNLSVYLNETCRNAMNLEDFLEGIIAKFANIDYVNDRETWDYAEGIGMMPYAEGVIKLLKDELAKLPPNERPIQCSDRKREIFHIKKGGEWIVGSVDKHVKDALFDLGQTRVGYVIQWKRQNGGVFDDKKMDAARTRLMKNLLPGIAAGSADRARNKIANAVAEQTMIQK